MKLYQKKIINRLVTKIIKHDLSFKFDYNNKVYEMYVEGYINNKYCQSHSQNPDLLICLGGMLMNILQHEGNTNEKERSNW